MKMVKGLLLGSAAALVAMTGAQAADLPVKAAPVQYVKICSLYGAGFYYVPGTDLCLKIGGYVRAEYDLDAKGSFTPILNGVDSLHNRNSVENTTRSRGILSVDTRQQTEYGTLRTYMSFGGQSDNGATGVFSTALDRWFIQFAGFTAGFTTSYFDLFITNVYSNLTNVLGSDTSGSGTTVFAYTAQFGNGMSATVSAESADFRRSEIINTNVTTANAAGAIQSVTFSALTGFSNSYATSKAPDLVGNVRIDQAWGSAQLMGALHQVSGNYFGAVEGTGHPGDELGWAVGAGVTLNLPMLGKGDTFSIQGAYTEGALRYAAGGITQAGNIAVYDGNSVGFGIATDGVYEGATNSSIDLVKAWNVTAGISHYWTPQFKTALYGSYLKTDFGDSATAFLNTALTSGAAPIAAGVLVGDPNFAFWEVGIHNVWSPVANLDLSLDVLYNKLNSSYAGSTFNLNPGSGKPKSTYTVDDQSWWQGIVRVQRNFYP